MKIGVIVSSFRTSFKKAVAQAKRMGMDGIQINFTGYTSLQKMTDRRINKVLAAVEQAGLEISAFCGDLGGHGFADGAENPKKIILTKKMVDVAKKMNVKVITTHIGIIPENKNAGSYGALKSALTEIGAYAARNGVTLAIETGPEPARVLKDFLEGMIGVGVNLDPANFVMVTGQDPVEAVKMLGKYIVHTHAKDGKKLREGSPAEIYGSVEKGETHATPSTPMFTETPLGEGKVDWDAYIAALKEAGFDGFLTIERETSGNAWDKIKQAYDFLAGKLGFDKKITVAVVGCGGIANGAHFPSMAKCPQYKLKYAVDIIKERAEKAAAKYGISGYTKAITDYRTALEDAEVDAVIVCTHTNFHGKIAIEAMLSGKDVLSEKPVAMNADEAKKMLETAEATKRISNVALCVRYDATTNAVKSLIESGELGEIYSVYCSFRQFRNIPGIGGEFTNKAHSGGGVLFDWGVHMLDAILYALGNPKVLKADGAAYGEIGKDIKAYRTKGISYMKTVDEKGVFDVEDFVTGLVKTEGASISFNGAWAQNIDKNEMYMDFMGTKGGVRINYLKGYELYATENGRFVKRAPRVKGCNMYLEEHKNFVTDVLTRRISRQNIRNVIGTAELLEMIYKDAAR